MVATKTKEVEELGGEVTEQKEDRARPRAMHVGPGMTETCVCMCVPECSSVCACVFMCGSCVTLHAHVYICMSTCWFVCVCTCVQTCLCVRVFLCVHVCSWTHSRPQCPVTQESRCPTQHQNWNWNPSAPLSVNLSASARAYCCQALGQARAVPIPSPQPPQGFSDQSLSGTCMAHGCH